MEEEIERAQQLRPIQNGFFFFQRLQVYQSRWAQHHTCDKTKTITMSERKKIFPSTEKRREGAIQIHQESEKKREEIETTKPTEKKTRSEKKLFKWELNKISMMENVGSVGLVLVWLTDCEVDTTVFVCSSKFYMGTIISFECDKHEQNNLHVCVKCKTFEMCE